MLSVSFKEICFLLTYLYAFKVSTLSLFVSVLWFAPMLFDLYSSWIWFTELLKTMSLCLLTNTILVILGNNFNILELCHHVPYIFLFHFFPVIFLCLYKSAYFLLWYFSVHCFFFSTVSHLILNLSNLFFLLLFGFLNCHLRMLYMFQASHALQVAV